MQVSPPCGSSYDENYWLALHQCLNPISSLLNSLKAGTIGDGLVMYEESQSRFLPRSEYFNNHNIQWFLNIFNPQATFTKTKEGFEVLHERVDFLWTQLLGFHPKNPIDCSDQAIQLASRLNQEITEAMLDIAKKGVEKLAENYSKAGKSTKGEVLSGLAKRAFKGLTKCQELLITQLLLHASNPKDVSFLVNGLSNIVDCSQIVDVDGSEKLQEKDARFCSNLRKVVWDPKRGVIVPNELLLDCLADANQMEKNHHRRKKGPARLKANFQRVPLKATSIPAQNGEVHWHPLRFVQHGEEVIQEKGVVGTCERDGLANQGLCNFYFRIDPQTSHLAVSCELINTLEKAKQFAAGMAHIQTQMGPFANGRWLFQYAGPAENNGNVFSHLGVIKKVLQQTLQKENLSVLHLAPPLNFQPESSGRDLEVYAILLNYVILDAAKLLKDKVEFLLPSDGKGFLNEQSALWVSLAKEINGIKQQLHQGEQNEELAATLTRKETEIRAGLICMVNYLRIEIEMIERMLNDKNALPLGQTLLLFKAMHRILSSQLNLNNSHNHFQCSQIEDLLFLYRLLDIKVVFISQSGLDEAAIVMAMADAQSQLERKFYHEHAKKKGDPNAWLMARNKMFGLIHKLPEGRDNLFRRFSSRPYQGFSSIEMNRGITKTENVRESLMSEIEKTQPIEQEMLMQTFFYSELVAAHLIGPGAEMAFNSTGVIGHLIKDDSLLNRMAPLIYCEGKTLQLSSLSKGQAFDSTKVTNLGIALLTRSSALRKA